MREEANLLFPFSKLRERERLIWRRKGNIGNW